MSDQALATTPQPTRQAIEAKTRSAPRRVTGKLLVACKSIVWQGYELDRAAKHAGLTTRSLRLALERPHVITFMKTEREVFRAYVSAQNIHHAVKMRNGAGNAMARLGAMKFIEQLGDDPQASAGRASAAGFVVMVVDARSAHMAQERQNEAKPLIEHASVRHGPRDADD